MENVIPRRFHALSNSRCNSNWYRTHTPVKYSFVESYFEFDEVSAVTRHDGIRANGIEMSARGGLHVNEPGRSVFSLTNDKHTRAVL